MGSITTPLDGVKIQDTLGTDINIPVFIQFTPGYCVEVVHSTESIREKGDQSVNTIIALPHIQSADIVYLNKNTAEEDYRYFPLLRNHGDIPTKGDPVLLCTIGKTNYYLGPLNTINNSPTWNDDINYTPEKIYENDAIGETTERGLSGESPNFNKNQTYRRLIKKRNNELDYGDVDNETTGDYVIEGRHGNSLRIGSRSDNPYIFMSNARAFDNTVESLEDGSLISITSKGTLQQHLKGFIDEISEQSFQGFKLASDISPNNNRNMSDLITSIPENGEQNADQIIYNYSNNQILFNSERITINSDGNGFEGGIYLSSKSDTHIGAGRHLTISTNEDLIINSERTFLGNPTPNNSSREMEPMVLGIELLELLKETLTVIKNSQGICQGAPIALADETGVPGGVNTKITNIENKINRILSNKHFIEPNA